MRALLADPCNDLLNKYDCRHMHISPIYIMKHPDPERSQLAGILLKKIVASRWLKKNRAAPLPPLAPLPEQVFSPSMVYLILTHTDRQQGYTWSVCPSMMYHFATSVVSCCVPCVWRQVKQEIRTALPKGKKYWPYGTEKLPSTVWLWYRVRY